LNFTSAGEFTLENAVTLLALQEGISSRIKYDITRGHGLIDFIENCFDLSEDTKVAIISGKTAIKIDKKYRISNKNIFGRDRRIIALNSDNDLYKKPDPNYIRNTGVNFNGVIIETTIPLKIN
jgi:transcriptional regulator